MKRIRRSVRISRPREAVWEVIHDPARYPEFFVGITRWEAASEIRHEAGDRYHIVLEVGSIRAGSEIEIVILDPPTVLEWRAQSGPEHLARFVLSPDDGATVATVEVEIAMPSGALSRLAERLAGRIAGRHLDATLQALRHVCEFGPPAA